MTDSAPMTDTPADAAARVPLSPDDLQWWVTAIHRQSLSDTEASRAADILVCYHAALAAREQEVAELRGHNRVLSQELERRADSMDDLTKLLRAEKAQLRAEKAQLRAELERAQGRLTFDAFRTVNVARCLRWHPQGVESWSSSDWLTAVTGELGELASLLKMRNRERDGLVGNKFSPTDRQVADEIADVATYLDLLAVALGVDLGRAIAQKFNAVSQRNGFPDRLPALAPEASDAG